MNEIQKLSDEALNIRLSELVKKEREILSEVLLHIQEIDSRRLYLKFSFGSMFEYLTKHMGYSAGSAQRRIDAARLGKEIKSVVSDLETGALNLAQVGLLQKSIRQKQQAVSIEIKESLLEKMKHKTFQESQVLIARDLEIEIQQSSKTTCQADESVRLEITFSKEQWQKLEKMRSLISNSLPNGSWEQVLEYVSDKVIAAKTKTRGAVIEPQQRSFSVLRKQMLQKSKGCEHQNFETKKICGSQWKLQVDHKQPRWAGGSDRPENLRMLCALHNQDRYRRQAQIRLRS